MDLTLGTHVRLFYDKGFIQIEDLKKKNRKLVGDKRTMMGFAKSAEKEIAERQQELVLLKKAKGDNEFVPSGMEDAAAQQVVRDKAARLEWQMDKVQQQMKQMKQKAGALEDQWEAKVTAAEQECEEAKASLATATSSGSVHTDVWDGSANTRGKHLLAVVRPNVLIAFSIFFLQRY